MLCVWIRRSSEGFYCRWWKIHRQQDDLGVRDYSLCDLDDDFLNPVMFLKMYQSAADSGNTSRGLGSS